MTKDTRDYATCQHANSDPDTTPGATCGAPVQFTVERWGILRDDGAPTIDPADSGSSATGGGMLRVYCAEDHALGEYDMEPTDYDARGLPSFEFVRECLAEYEVTTASRGELDAGDDSAIPGSERTDAPIMDDRD